MKNNFNKKTYRRVEQQRLGEQDVRISRENDFGINQNHDYRKQRG